MRHPPFLPPFHTTSDRKLLSDKLGLDSVAEEIDFSSRVSIVKGVSSHLQCPGCNRPIEDPRMLACAHTFCRPCLDKAVRKTVDATSKNSIPNPLPNAASKAAEPLFMNYDLRRILGSSLSEELRASLSKVLDSDFGAAIGGLEPPVEKPSESKSSSKANKRKNKSKGTNKTQEHNAISTTPSSSVETDAKKTEEKATGASSESKKTSPLSSSAPSSSSSSSSSKSSGTIEVLVCPECGGHTEIPNGNISLIPYNFFMQHIMDLMTYYSSAEPVPLVYCSMCRKDGLTQLPPAVARCSTCASFLCKQCYELHSIDDFTKLHSTLSITERGESSIFSCLTPDDTKVRNCKLHNWKPFLYYCITCSKGICETCSKQEHESHLYSRPENLRSDYVSYIRDLMSRTTQLRRRTESAVKTTQDLMSGIQLLAATQIEEILRSQDILSSGLDTRLKVLLEEVDRISATTTTTSAAAAGDGSSGGSEECVQDDQQQQQR